MLVVESLISGPDKYPDKLFELLIPACGVDRRGHGGESAPSLLLGASSRLSRSDQSGRRVEVARMLLEAGADAKTLLRDGDTPLMVAIRAGHAPMARELIASSELDRQNAKGQTALMLAVETGQLSLVRQLAAASDASLRDDQGRTACLIAAGRVDATNPSSILCLLRLLAPGACDGAGKARGALFHLMDEALEELFDIAFPLCDSKDTDADGATPLHLAVVKRSHRALLRLLPVSDPLAWDNQGRTALMLAANQCSDMVRNLLPVSEANAQDEGGRTALMFMLADCYWTFREEIGQVLAEATDLSLRNSSGQTAADLAEASGDEATKAFAPRLRQMTQSQGERDEFEGIIEKPTQPVHRKRANDGVYSQSKKR